MTDFLQTAPVSSNAVSLTTSQPDEVPEIDENDPLYANFKGIFDRFNRTEEVSVSSL